MRIRPIMNMKIFIVLLILVVFSGLAIQSAYSQYVHLELFSSVLQTGIITANNVNYLISNNIDVRYIGDGKILRITGITVDGHPYYAYNKIIGDKIISKGGIFIDGKILPLEFNTLTSTKQKTPQIEDSKSTIEESSDTEEPTNMKILVRHGERVYWGQAYTISIRVFDTETNNLNNFDYNSGFINDVDVSVDILNSQNELITSFNGTTTNTGFFDGSFIFNQNLHARGVYTADITANAGSDQTTKTVSISLLGQRTTGCTPPC